MAIIKVIKGGYDTPYQMKKLIDYIVNSSRHDIRGMVGGSMLSTGTMQYVYYQMMDLKKSMSKIQVGLKLKLTLWFMLIMAIVSSCLVGVVVGISENVVINDNSFSLAKDVLEIYKL